VQFSNMSPQTAFGDVISFHWTNS